MDPSQASDNAQGGHAPETFPHGVASFDPTADSVVLWARVEPGPDAPTALRWCVAPATDVAPTASGEVGVPDDTNGCVAVVVDGLLPATTYRYWFEAGGERSPMGRTRTLPASGTEPFRIAVVCCADYSQGQFGVYRAAADATVDLVLHVGDYIYESPGRGSARPAEPDKTLATVEDYRARYAQTRADPDLIALHQRHPMVAVWDDHDIADNAWRHGAKAHDDASEGPWEDRLAAATRAWHEWVPSQRPGLGRPSPDGPVRPDDPLAIWRSFPVGDLAELVLLDTRVDGRDEHADHEGSRALDDPERAMLGDAQREWAHERVRDTTRPWSLLVTAVVLNRMQLPVPVGARVNEAMPSGYAVVDGAAICTDEWDGYPAERDRLVAALADRRAAGRASTVVVSGDVHSAWAFEGPLDADGEPVAVEVVAPCVTSTPMGAQLPRGWRKLAGELAERLPEARWFELEHRGFVVLDVDPERVRADWYTVDIGARRVRPEPAASWVTRLDRPGRFEEVEVHARPDAPDAPAPAPTDAPVAVPRRPAEIAPPGRRRRVPVGPAAAGAVVAAALGVWLWRHPRRH